MIQREVKRERLIAKHAKKRETIKQLLKSNESYADKLQNFKKLQL